MKNKKRTKKKVKGHKKTFTKIYLFFFERFLLAAFFFFTGFLLELLFFFAMLLPPKKYFSLNFREKLLN